MIAPWPRLAPNVTLAPRKPTSSSEWMEWRSIGSFHKGRSTSRDSTPWLTHLSCLFADEAELGNGAHRAQKLDLLDLCVRHLQASVFWTPVERSPILEPGGPDFLFPFSLIIGRREQGDGSF